MSEAEVAPTPEPSPEPSPSPSPEPTPAPTPATPPPGWRDGFSPDLRENPTLSRFDSPESLARAHVEIQKMVGGEKVPVPRDDWTPEQWQTYHRAMGRPETPEGYDLSGFTPPEGVPWNDGFLESMVGEMHEAGLSQRQVAHILDKYGEAIGNDWSQSRVNVEQAQAQAKQELQQEWGNAFAAKVDAAARALRMGAGEHAEAIEHLELADGTVLGNNPAFLRLLASFGDRMSEHGIEGDKRFRLTMTPEEAAKERRKLMGDEDFRKAYFDKSHIEHDDAVRRIADLTTAEVGDEIIAEVG